MAASEDAAPISSAGLIEADRGAGSRRFCSQHGGREFLQDLAIIGIALWKEPQHEPGHRARPSREPGLEAAS
jgi:hypothetical protein